MNNFTYAIYFVDSATPASVETSLAEDVVSAYTEHDWDAQLTEMKRQIDRQEMYFLPQFTVSRGNAHMSIEPGNNDASTVSAHNINATKPWHHSNSHLQGFNFSENRVVQTLTRFLAIDDDWLWVNLDN